MQTTIATPYTAETAARPAAHPQTKTPSRLLKTLACKWDMIGVLAVMGSAVYAASQLMTLAR